ncbi:hypothetical protein JCM10212_004649 [Sporobolomyces blumeae]
MFFDSDLLTKRGALAQVWMASHLSTKLSKQALTSTSIPKSVQSILGQDLLPMALRLSGQLLLGIARIYSRKTKYLLDDAQETLGKVKKAFQNEGRAAVDLPDDQQVQLGGEEGGRGNRDINLRRDGGDLEDLLAAEFAEGEWSLEKYLAANASKDSGKGKGKALTANIADITLDESHTHSGFFDLDPTNDFAAGDLDLDLGFDPDFALFDEDDELNAITGPSNGQSRPKKRSREDGAEGEEADDISVELGRDAAPHASSDRGSIAPFDFRKEFDHEYAMPGVEGGPDDLGGFDGNFDLGLDVNDGFIQNDFGGGGPEEDGEKLPEFDDFSLSRAGSIPPLANTEAGDSLQLTPRAAAAVNAREAEQSKQPAKKRQKALAVDKVIELDWQSARLAGKERFKEPEFLPRSRLHLALLTSDAHLSLLPQALPKASKTSTALELYAPPGLLAPELRDLFKMPTRRERIRLEGRERDKNIDRPVEQGRRAMSVLSNLSNLRHDDEFDNLDHLNRDFGGGEEGDLTFGLGDEGADLGGFDGNDNLGFDLDLGGEQNGANEVEEANKTPSKRAKKQKTSHGRDELEVTPAPSVTSARGILDDEDKVYRSEGPLAVFDELGSARTISSSRSLATATPSRSQALSQSLATEEEEAAAAAAASQAETLTQKTGSVSLQSRNTRKAVKVIQDQLDEVDAADEAEKKVEFNRVADKASRRAASSFFFELLVLSSADVVKLKQHDAYGDIEVRGTSRLREIAV